MTTLAAHLRAASEEFVLQQYAHGVEAGFAAAAASTEKVARDVYARGIRDGFEIAASAQERGLNLRECRLTITDGKADVRRQEDA